MHIRERTKFKTLYLSSFRERAGKLRDSAHLIVLEKSVMTRTASIVTIHETRNSKSATVLQAYKFCVPILRFELSYRKAAKQYRLPESAVFDAEQLRRQQPPNTRNAQPPAPAAVE